MGAIRTIVGSQRRVAIVALTLCAGAVVAFAQQPAEPPPAAAHEFKFDPLGSIARWLDELFAKLGSNFKTAKGTVDNFNREAGVAAKTTADAARDAADAVVRLPNARTISGHQTCVVASNGGPDCVTAAMTMCKAQGYKSGKSVDMTSAEECPAAVMLGRRPAEAGECKTVTFVTRSLCQ